MCIQTKRDTATDITKLLMNTEELMVVIHNEVLPSGQQLDSSMLEAIPEEEDSPSSDGSLLNEEDHRQPQHHPQLQQPPSSSSSSPATPIEHRARHDKDRRKHTNGQTINQTQGTSKFNLMRSFIMAAILTMIAMLLIAVTIQNEKQNIVRREAHEFHQSAREAIRQAEQRRDMRRERWG